MKNGRFLPLRCLKKRVFTIILSVSFSSIIIKEFRIILSKLYFVIIFLLIYLPVIAADKGNFVLKPAADGRELNSILASVNGEAISLHDILPYTRDKEYVAYASCQSSELAQVIFDIRKKAVDELIDRKLIVADYRAGKFRIPAREIDAELDRVAVNTGAKSRQDFIAKLRRAGVEYAKMRNDVEEYMAVQLMLHRCAMIGNVVTPEELYNYYNSHKDEFLKPDSVELAMILVKDEAAASEIAGKLKNAPEMFAELASRYSEGPGRENGGLLGAIEIRRLRSEFSSAIKVFENGRVYGPVKTAEGINFLKVVKFIPGSSNDYFSVLPALREKLEAKRREMRFEEYKLSLRKKAVVRYFFIPETYENQKVEK